MNQEILLLVTLLSCTLVTNIALASNDDDSCVRTVNCDKPNASVQKQVDKLKRGRDGTISSVGFCNESVAIVSDGVISKGSFIKFSNHAKIYMVTADVAAGTVPVSIYPTLRSAVAITDTFKTGASATLTYYRDVSNLRGLTFTDGILSSTGTVNLVEGLV